MSKSVVVGLVLLVLPLTSPAAKAEEPGYSKITAHPVALPSRGWPASQVLQADKQGRVFLLRTDTLDVFQISRDGELAPKGSLLREGEPLKRPPLQGGALSPAGDAWLLFSFPNHLYVIQGERVASLEAPWLVSAVAMDGGEPLVAVLPGEMASAAPSVSRLDAPPLLQQWDGKRWNTVLEGRFQQERAAGVSLPEQLRGEFAVLLALTPERHLWMADRHVYRLRRFSPSRRLLDELVVGEGKVRWKQRSEEEWARTETLSKKGGLPFSRRNLSAVRAEEAIRAMAVGRDGALYLLVKTEKGLALDRFQPGLVALDRVLLSGFGIPGKVMMAAGTQGLYISAWASREGLWHIDAETLLDADWRPVPEAVLNGAPLVAPEKDTSGSPKPVAGSVKASGSTP